MRRRLIYIQMLMYTEHNPNPEAINCWIECCLCGLCTRLPYAFIIYCTVYHALLSQKINTSLTPYDFTLSLERSKLKLTLRRVPPQSDSTGKEGLPLKSGASGTIIGESRLKAGSGLGKWDHVTV